MPIFHWCITLSNCLKRCCLSNCSFSFHLHITQWISEDSLYHVRVIICEDIQYSSIVKGQSHISPVYTVPFIAGGGPMWYSG